MNHRLILAILFIQLMTVVIGLALIIGVLQQALSIIKI